MSLSEFDKSCMKAAILLAKEAEMDGNLPVGAVIALDGEIIASGKNSIWIPRFNQVRHAEIEALRNVPGDLWRSHSEMRLYTTLEPCLMCLGAILLHRIGRVLFGSADPYGGAGMVFGHLPRFFEDQIVKTAWIGPAYQGECDPMFARMQELERNQQLL